MAMTHLGEPPKKLKIFGSIGKVRIPRDFDHDDKKPLEFLTDFDQDDEKY